MCAECARARVACARACRALPASTRRLALHPRPRAPAPPHPARPPEFYAKDGAGKWTKSFLVKIAPFKLRADI